MNQKKNIPQKGAATKLAQRLKELGQKLPPEDLVKKINKNENKKVASPAPKNKDLEME